MVTVKLRNLEPKVRELYTHHNNLTVDLRNALKELIEQVKSNHIVICRSDKD